MVAYKLEGFRSTNSSSISAFDGCMNHFFPLSNFNFLLYINTFKWKSGTVEVSLCL